MTKNITNKEWEDLKTAIRQLMNINPYDINDYNYINILKDVLDLMKEIEE